MIQNLFVHIDVDSDTRGRFVLDMIIQAIALGIWLLPQSASFILPLHPNLRQPDLGTVVDQTRFSISDSSSSFVEHFDNYWDQDSGRYRQLCVLHPKGDGQLDDESFKSAVSLCGTGGIIRLPDFN
jgi:hypothetical protein